MSNITSSALDVYFDELQRFSQLLSKQEEYDTAVAAANGDKAARDTMIQSNLRLVLMVAKKYQNYSLDWDEIIQEGNTGLMHAVDKFDPERGCRFSTYAVWWIRNNIEQYIMNHGRTIRIPIHVTRVYKQILRASSELGLDLDTNEGITKISQELKISPRKVLNILGHYFNEGSLDKEIISGDNLLASLKDLVAAEVNCQPDIRYEKCDYYEYMDALLEYLPVRSQNIIRLRFGFKGQDPMSLEAIAQLMDISRERVRQIIRNGLSQVREQLCANDLVKEDFDFEADSICTINV